MMTTPAFVSNHADICCTHPSMQLTELVECTGTTTEVVIDNMMTSDVRKLVKKDDSRSGRAKPQNRWTRRRYKSLVDSSTEQISIVTCTIGWMLRSRYAGRLSVGGIVEYASHIGKGGMKIM